MAGISQKNRSPCLSCFAAFRIAASILARVPCLVSSTVDFMSLRFGDGGHVFGIELTGGQFTAPAAIGGGTHGVEADVPRGLSALQRMLWWFWPYVPPWSVGSMS